MAVLWGVLIRGATLISEVLYCPLRVVSSPTMTHISIVLGSTTARSLWTVPTGLKSGTTRGTASCVWMETKVRWTGLGGITFDLAHHLACTFDLTSLSSFASPLTFDLIGLSSFASPLTSLACLFLHIHITFDYILHITFDLMCTPLYMTSPLHITFDLIGLWSCTFHWPGFAWYDVYTFVCDFTFARDLTFDLIPPFRWCPQLLSQQLHWPQRWPQVQTEQVYCHCKWLHYCSGCGHNGFMVCFIWNVGLRLWPLRDCWWG